MAMLLRFKKCATIEQKPAIYQQYQSDFNCSGYLSHEIGGLRVGYAMFLVYEAGLETAAARKRGGRKAMLPIANKVVHLVQVNQMEGCDIDTELLLLSIVKKLEYYCGVLNKIFTKQMEKDLYLISKECNKFIDTSVTI